MGRDLISTHKAIPLFSVNQTGTVGLHRGNEADLRAAMAGAHDLREDVTNMLVIVDIDVGNAGTVDLVIQHRTTQSVAMTNYASITQITADGLYIFEINRLRRYVQVAATIAGNTVVMSINAAGNRHRAAPVRQTGTELTVTYNSTP